MRLTILLMLLSVGVIAEVKPEGTVLETECASTRALTFCSAQAGKQDFITLRTLTGGNEQTYYVFASSKEKEGPRGSTITTYYGRGVGPHLSNPGFGEYPVLRRYTLIIKSDRSGRYGELLVNGKNIGASGVMEVVFHTESVSSNSCDLE